MQATHAIPHTGVHEEHHEHAGFWRTYIFSTDHKIIGIQYGITALCFLFFGFLLMMMMRWQIAHPNVPVPIVGPLLEKVLGSVASQGKISAELYNSFGHARDHHGVSRDCAAGVCGVRELRGAADDWRARYGVPAREHGELSIVCGRRC